VRHYRFLSTWLLAAPIERVWDEIDDAERWPEWWRGVQRVELVDVNRWRSTWRSALPYSLTFDFAVERRTRPYELRGRASGDLEGVGTWRLYEAHGETASTWEWDVAVTASWVNALGPLPRPALAWNHRVIMRRGAHGLARRLGCELVAAS
jgi:uncharacterized protein YndB with AHSA1/START domain